MQRLRSCEHHPPFRLCLSPSSSFLYIPRPHLTTTSPHLQSSHSLLSISPASRPASHSHPTTLPQFALIGLLQAGQHGSTSTPAIKHSRAVEHNQGPESSTMKVRSTKHSVIVHRWQGVPCHNFKHRGDCPLRQPSSWRSFFSCLPSALPVFKASSPSAAPRPAPVTVSFH